MDFKSDTGNSDYSHGLEHAAWADHSRHAGLKEECGSCLAADYAKLTAPDDLRRARTRTTPAQATPAQAAPAQDTYTPGEFGELDPMTYTPGLASFYSVDAMRADAALRTARTRMVTALPGTPAVEDAAFTEDTVAAWCGPAVEDTI